MTVYETTLPDGLYQVTTKYLCASFIVENGRVVRGAPILRNRIAYWQTIAKKVEVEDEQ